MKQLFILNATEQAALMRGQSQILRMSDGTECEFRFESSGRANGTRPPVVADGAPIPDIRRLRLPLAALAAPVTIDERVRCPKCTGRFNMGTAMHMHLRLRHELSTAERKKLFPFKRRAPRRRAR